jgi:hypothetical protein
MAAMTTERANHRGHRWNESVVCLMSRREFDETLFARVSQRLHIRLTPE